MNYKVYINCLEMLQAFAFMLVISSGLSLKKPAVAPHHVGVETTLIASLSCAHSLVENDRFLCLLPTSSTLTNVNPTIPPFASTAQGP